MMVPGVVNTAAFQIWLSGGCGQYCAKYPALAMARYSFPAVQDFNFHTNLKSDHKLPCIQRSRLTPGSIFNRWGWISFAPLVTPDEIGHDPL